jgi:PDZ domain
MALVACYECGGKVSTSAAACPHCGAPSKRQTSIAETDNLIKNNAVTAENENREDVNQTTVKEKTKRIYGWMLAAGLVLVFLVVVILVTQSKPLSPETVSLINSEGSTVSCPPKSSDSCVRDAESKGFVKLSNAVAGITVDWKAKPLRVIEVRGTAAEAGVRNGDILVELDGSTIVEPLSIFMLMGSKQPGDELKVKVMRDGRPLNFVYNVMPR